MAVFIDLNADLGEGSPYDAELLSVVSSCNIACGGHAGNESSMRSTLALAIRHGVAVGAHPSYPDRDGFGRRRQFLSGSPLRDSLLEQITGLRVIAEKLGVRIAHVKLHGALYNDSAEDARLAAVVASVIQQAVPGAALVGPPNCELASAARSSQMLFIAEAFIDRAYRDDGQLLPRGQPGAVHTNTNQVVAQAITLATQKKVESCAGHSIDVAADTLCLHGDTPGAAAAAAAVRQALQNRGVEIRAIGRR